MHVISKMDKGLDTKYLLHVLSFYYFQIADGMTLQVQTVNLLLETRGGARCRGGAAW